MSGDGNVNLGSAHVCSFTEDGKGQICLMPKSDKEKLPKEIQDKCAPVPGAEGGYSCPIPFAGSNPMQDSAAAAQNATQNGAKKFANGEKVPGKEENHADGHLGYLARIAGSANPLIAVGIAVCDFDTDHPFESVANVVMSSTPLYAVSKTSWEYYDEFLSVDDEGAATGETAEGAGNGEAIGKPLPDAGKTNPNMAPAVGEAASVTPVANDKQIWPGKLVVDVHDENGNPSVDEGYIEAQLNDAPWYKEIKDPELKKVFVAYASGFAKQHAKPGERIVWNVDDFGLEAQWIMIAASGQKVTKEDAPDVPKTSPVLVHADNTKETIQLFENGKKGGGKKGGKKKVNGAKKGGAKKKKSNGMHGG